MFVTGKNGRRYCKDHPKEVIAPDVMTFDQIRTWLRTLTTDPAYGWAPGGIRGLERALGMRKDTLKDKLKTGWIWPRQQVALTRRLEDVLQGYIVPRQFGTRKEGVWTDPPQPPTIQHVRVLRGTVGIQGIQLRAAPPPPRFPAFSSIFQDVSTWDPDQNRRDKLARAAAAPLRAKRRAPSELT